MAAELAGAGQYRVAGWRARGGLPRLDAGGQEDSSRGGGLSAGGDWIEKNVSARALDRCWWGWGGRGAHAVQQHGTQFWRAT